MSHELEYEYGESIRPPEIDEIEIVIEMPKNDIIEVIKDEDFEVKLPKDEIIVPIEEAIIIEVPKVEELIQKSEDITIIEDLEEDASRECPCIKVKEDELPNKDIVFYFCTSVDCEHSEYCEEREEDLCWHDDMDKE